MTRRHLVHADPPCSRHLGRGYSAYFRHYSRTLPVLGLVGLGLVLLISLAGCWNPFSSDSDKNDRDKEPTLNLLPRTTPENVLHNLRVIYGSGDNLATDSVQVAYWSEMYASLFHPDSFKFYFIPGDVPPWCLEGWWGKTEEAASFESMLRYRAEGQIDDIQLWWVVNPSEPDDRPDHDGWRHITVSSILLDVIQGDTTYRVSNGIAEFYFVADTADTTLWVIREWLDERLPGSSSLRTESEAGTAGESSTWGKLKGLFYRQPA